MSVVDPTATSPNDRVTVVQPPRGLAFPNLREVWQARDLIRLLVYRDFSTRYRQSIVGLGWAVLRPALSVAIYTLVFSYVIRVNPPGDTPYALFVFAALIPWLYFSGSLQAVVQSVLAGSGMLTKVYFPRLVLPLASTTTPLIELLIQLVLIVVLSLCFGVVPSLGMLVLPVFVLLAIGSAMGFGVWLAALNVKYRDIGMVVPLMIQIWMYLCPIVYPMDLIRERTPNWFQFLYSLNPMVSVIEGFRWSILSTPPPSLMTTACGFASVAIVLIGGLFFFRYAERDFADLI